MSDSKTAFFARPVGRACIALVMVLCLGAVFNADGAFFKLSTHASMMRHISRFGILACGMTLVIIAGGIDLSVGSILAVAAVCFSLFTIHFGMPAPTAVAACLAVGLLCGMVSGFLVGKWKIQPFIATLAMMVSARGLAKVISGGQKVSTAVQHVDGSYDFREAPPVFDFLTMKLFGGNLFIVTIIFLVCVLLCWILLRKLRWGRYLYAMGGNMEAARLSGLPILKMNLLAYGLCGLFSALAGICHAAEELQGDPEAGQTYELTAIAIVVVGGTNLAGGRGGIMLTLLGALIIGYVEKILSINAAPEAHRLVLTGAIIIAAVIFQRTRK